MNYRQAGVDIDAGEALVEAIKPFARRTLRPEVMAGIGGFGALVRVSKKYREPVLVSGTDGVGTKLKLAFRAGKHDTVGIDLVAMSVNDILVQGAEPLFFLDYFACGRLDVAVASEVIKGIAKGCELAGCALIGGETAEMPDMYPKGEYDLAGFAVGVVERSRILDGSAVAPGDAILGLASSGAHSNGYSLIRSILRSSRRGLNADFHGRPLGEVLLEPTKIYVKPILSLRRRVPVNALAHITGGGLLENLPRVLPPKVKAVVREKAWPLPPLFQWLKRAGNVTDAEMRRVFNCGIGMALVIPETAAETAMKYLIRHGEIPYRIGRIERRRTGDPAILFV